MKLLRKAGVALTMAATLGIVPFAATATAQENYPSRSIHLIVPVAPGGGTDFAARLLADEMSKKLGASMVVENRPGGAGNIGVASVADAKPDGYTLVMPITSFPINATLYDNLPFDTQKDLAPVALVASLPLVLVVNPEVPADTVPELIALAKEKPGTLNFANSGVGTTAHLSGELLKRAANVDIVSVAYKGGGPAVTDLLGGHVQMYFSTPAAVMPHIKDNRLKPLAVTSATRLAELPDVPTLVELGMPDLEVKAWFGIFAPADTPPAVIKKLNTVANEVLQQSSVKERMATQGFQAEGTMSPEDMQKYLDDEIEKWGAVINDLGLKASMKQ